MYVRFPLNLSVTGQFDTCGGATWRIRLLALILWAFPISVQVSNMPLSVLMSRAAIGMPDWLTTKNYCWGRPSCGDSRQAKLDILMTILGVSNLSCNIIMKGT